MRFVISIYSLLLLYTVAALLFWGFSLQRQSQTIYSVERREIEHHIDSVASPALYKQKLEELTDHLEKRRKQYIGEGATFMAVILIGAGIVYTSLQRKVRLQRQQTNFMLAVTHELKSPIAGIKLSVQTMQKHQLAKAQSDQLLSRCNQEADRLSELCNNMLITSQIEGRQYKAAQEQISLSRLAANCAEVFSSRYPGRIRTEILEDCFVIGDSLLLQLAINNLLENAIKYTPAESPIVVRLVVDRAELHLEVADQGSGVPDAEKRKIFSKFYRIGDEATRKSKGTGLGLYLTRRIVKTHKGQISVRDNQPQGAIFRIALPAA